MIGVKLFTYRPRYGEEWNAIAVEQRENVYFGLIYADRCNPIERYYLVRRV